MRIINRIKGISESKAKTGFYLLLFLIIWLYIWLRAGITQLTHDETATFFRYIQLGKFLPFDSEWSANNHILNSLLSYFFYKLFGADTLVLRLANVLSFPLFFYFLVRISAYIKDKSLGIAFVVILSLTHNFIEFFAMSRGYGLSMAFLMAALWHLIMAMKHVKSRHYLLSIVFAILALSANLTLLNSVLVILFLLSARLIASQKTCSIKHWVCILLPGLGTVVFFTVFLLELQERGELYYGLTTGFWEVTVRTLINTMLEPGGFMMEIFAGIYFTFILFFGAFFMLRKFSIDVLFKPQLLFFYLLLGNIAAAILLRYLFRVNYPEDRTGLYFVPFFTGGIIFTADIIKERWQLKSVYLLLLPLLFIPLHFILNMNLTHNSFENHKIPASLNPQPQGRSRVSISRFTGL